jgi:ankyrin repeat protein
MLRNWHLYITENNITYTSPNAAAFHKILTQIQVDINRPDDNNKNDIYSASAWVSVDINKLLLDKEISVNFTSTHYVLYTAIYFF